jgi:prevent-host-death family protein
MRIASLADVKARLSAYVEQCETEGPVVITRNGKAVAVLLAPADDDNLEGLLWAGTVYDHVMVGAPYWMGAIVLVMAGLMLVRPTPKVQQVS